MSALVQQTGFWMGYLKIFGILGPIPSVILCITVHIFQSANTVIYYQVKGIGSFIRLLAIMCLWMIYRIAGKMMTRVS